MNSKQFYTDIAELLFKLDSAKAEEFNKIIKVSSPKEVYMWLDTTLLKNQISSELENVMKDFFFSIH